VLVTIRKDNAHTDVTYEVSCSGRKTASTDIDRTEFNRLTKDGDDCGMESLRGFLPWDKQAITERSFRQDACKQCIL